MDTWDKKFNDYMLVLCQNCIFVYMTYNFFPAPFGDPCPPSLPPVEVLESPLEKIRFYMLICSARFYFPFENTSFKKNCIWNQCSNFSCHSILSPLRNTRTYEALQGPLSENITSSAKPEVYRVSQRRQRRTGQG